MPSVIPAAVLTPVGEKVASMLFDLSDPNGALLLSQELLEAHRNTEGKAHYIVHVRDLTREQLDAWNAAQVGEGTQETYELPELDNEDD